MTPRERDARERAREPQHAKPLTPAVDVVDTDGHVQVFADLPGCDRNRIQLHASGTELRIEAERDDVVGEQRTHQRERSANIERTIDLPDRASVDDATAAYENGVLRIDLPKGAPEEERAIGFE